MEFVAQYMTEDIFITDVVFDDGNVESDEVRAAFKRFQYHI